MDDLLALADRVEALTSPDRETDAAIGRVALGDDRAFIKAQIPRYTASLDAAMTLIPNGAMLVQLSDIAAEGMSGCGLCTDTSTSPPVMHWGEASERSADRAGILARCVTAAALRARHAQREKSDG